MKDCRLCRKIQVATSCSSFGQIRIAFLLEDTMETGSHFICKDCYKQNLMGKNVHAKNCRAKVLIKNRFTKASVV